MSEKIIDEVMELVRQLALSGVDYGASDGKQERTDKLKTLNDAEQAIRAKLREVLERKPLTDEQILSAFRDAVKVPTIYAGWVRDQRIEYGRSLERAHGIGT